jgi:hypothetical protein
MLCPYPCRQEGNKTVDEQSAITPNDDDRDEPRLERWSVKDWAGPAACYAALVVVAWWGSSLFAEQPHASVAKIAAPIPQAIIHRAPVPAQIQAVPVRVANPFDATEVFEFPAGTSDAESREKVAALLVHRAQARLNQWARNAPKSNLRTAKNL